jgi:hypothetical protein
MTQVTDLRELSAVEIEEVAGGLSVSATVGATAGLNVNASDVFGEVNTLVKDVGGLASGLVGGLLGAVGGVTGGL